MIMMNGFNEKYKESASKRQEGQGLVEFALILLILIGLFLGAFEVFFVYQQRTDVEVVTRRTVRQAAESYTDSATYVDEMTNYAYEQFEDLGYDRTYLEDYVTVEITGYNYLTSTQELAATTPSIDYCVYGDYIHIKVSKPLESGVVPVTNFFDAASIYQTYSAEQINRCWRGN